MKKNELLIKLIMLTLTLSSYIATSDDIKINKVGIGMTKSDLCHHKRA